MLSLLSIWWSYISFQVKSKSLTILTFIHFFYELKPQKLYGFLSLCSFLLFEYARCIQVLCACMQSWSSCVSLCTMYRVQCTMYYVLWSVACQAPLSMGSSRQEYWSGLSSLPPRDLPDSGILYLPVLVGGFFTTSAMWEAHIQV